MRNLFIFIKLTVKNSFQTAENQNSIHNLIFIKAEQGFLLISLFFFFLEIEK